MVIGLFGERYDINDIISFFNQEGTIIFSNEADKYYKFQIFNQIDYEALLKFKTANITFHCQPFKYKLNENPVTLSSGDNTVVNEGNIYSKPTLNIKGSGTISVFLDGNQIFNIDLSEKTEIEIDTSTLEAYNPNDGTLLNRIVTGDYDAFRLASGNNTISVSGTITSASISNYSRWL